MNVLSTASRSCVRSGTLRTGSTLRAAYEYITKVQPYMIWLENVAALENTDRDTGSSNAGDVINMLEAVGYIVVPKVVDARQHGAPQRRTRWWAVAIFVADRALTQGDVSFFQAQVEEVYRLLEAMEMSPVSLDKILLVEGSDDLKDWQDYRLGRATADEVLGGSSEE
eukprot:3995086-Pyramimonas_sp.AAC.1